MEKINFHPRSPCGERRGKHRTSENRGNFYPRSPCGERHNVVSKTVPAGEISIHALLAESDDIGNLTIEGFFISIHALLAESDGKSTTLTRIAWISIHALLAESDCPASWFDLWGGKFLSTLSLRRATWKKSPPMCFTKHFYPRSPCGERLTLIWDVIAVITISIHALLAESDTCFQLWSPPLQHFYPRSPCGERLKTPPQGSRSRIFLSTLSLRRATKTFPGIAEAMAISIHALLAESDTIFAVRPYDAPIFLSTLSLRRATAD